MQSVILKETVLVQEDVLLNDSDKTFTVPAGEEWEILTIQVQLVTTATVGNRQMALLVKLASDNILFRAVAGAVQAASITNRYNFAPGVADQTAFVNGDLQTPIAPLRLAPGHQLQVQDVIAVDAAADDMEVRILYIKREA